LRTLLGYQWLFPGKKLLFMGGEFGQSDEWNANSELQWGLLEAGPYHRGLQRLVEDLNKLYLAEPALWKSDYDLDGFHWIDNSDHANSVLSFLRQDPEHFHELVVIANLTPVPRPQYRVGLPRPGQWRELLNSDAAVYGGSNMGNSGGVMAADKPCHNQPCSAEFILPPLSILVFRPERAADKVVADSQTAQEKTPDALPVVAQLSSVSGRRRTLTASGGDKQRPSGSPSPPLEERAGERRPIILPDAAVRGDIPASGRPSLSGVVAENNDLLSLPLSSKEGEGNGAVASEHQGAFKAQGVSTPVPPLPQGEGRGEEEGSVENNPAPKDHSRPTPPGTRGSGTSS
jgi:hypothetical protein